MKASPKKIAVRALGRFVPCDWSIRLCRKSINACYKTV
jgi:hypothetical protein